MYADIPSGMYSILFHYALYCFYMVTIKKCIFHSSLIVLYSLKRKVDVLMKILLDLFLTFVQIGGLTFGGGYAMLPMLQKEVVDKKKWASEEELMDYYAIGQCTPGVIAVNTATFIGYKISGIPGAVFATLGVIFPSFVIITVVALFLRNFAQYPIVQHAFSGITVCVCVLILNAVIRLGKKSITDAAGVFIFLLTFLLSIIFDLSPAYLIIIAGLLGIIFSLVKTKALKGGHIS